MKIHKVWPLLLAGLLSGCGTYHTLRSGNVADASDLRLKGTYCQAIPRVYGGVVWDICQFYGEPPASSDEAGYKPPPTPSNNKFGMPILAVLDMALSGVTDTLALPYTIYRQQRDGSIELTHD
ncbi:MAG: YceK/YidQ family lipoprotein [Pseudomonas sp.]|uniref:YceK/YidQ family lipoprotein n=1 Tax=Pseudomonas sp. TaxID=306 RepID=UPI000CB5909E|nr:YceK/YidQ family lipoprotein [Pseudomonas sp.]PJI47103.1 MAG: YceK/YidQ family lipoprotein [Pseudomonas sp.]